MLARVVHRAPLALAQGTTAKPMISGITSTPDDGLRVRLEGPVR